MFTYLNPAVRERLVDEGSLLRIDACGCELDLREQAHGDELSLNLLGPIALPIAIGGNAQSVSGFAAEEEGAGGGTPDMGGMPGMGM